MKATVDKDLCIGCGVCEQICNTVFEINGDVAKTKVETVPADAEASCREAVEACPVEAIAITE
jgi:ferredoxin